MSGSKMSIDLAKVRDLSLVDNFETEVESPHGEHEIFEIRHQTYDDAKQAELQSWIDNDVYEEVPNSNQKCYQ